MPQVRCALFFVKITWAGVAEYLRHCVSETQYTMQDARPRLPWSREFLTAFRLLGAHPIVWQRDQFVVSGIGFVLYNYLISAVFVFGAIGRSVWPASTAANDLPDKFRRNPIAKELETFMSFLYYGFQLVPGVLIFALASQRKKIAHVFNLLNELWLRLGQPPVRLPVVSLVSGVSSSIFGIAILQTMFSQVDTSLSWKDRPLVIALKVLRSYLWCTMKIYFSLGYCFAIFVYGAVVDMLRFIPKSAKDGDFHIFLKVDVQETVEILRDVLTTFSSVFSPIIFCSLASSYLYTIFSIVDLTIPDEIRKSRLEFAYQATSAITVTVVLALSNAVTDLVKDLRRFIRNDCYFLRADCAIQDIDSALEETQHPMKLLGVYDLDLSVLLSLITFAVNYFVIFVQLKAIIVGSYST